MKNMEVIISCLDQSNLDECSHLYVKTFKQAPWNENWSMGDAFERLSDFLASPNTVALKAIQNGCILGFLIGEIQRWNGARFYYLKEICVGGETQRKGIGKSLIKNLESALQKEEVTRIYLITQRDSIPANFYGSLEFNENKNIMVMGKAV